MWQNIVASCLSAGEEVLGIKKKSKKHNDEELEKMSNEQMQLKNKIDASKNTEKRKELKCERKSIMKEIKNKVCELEEEKLDAQLKEIENYKDDSNKCYQAIRVLKNRKPKKTIIVQDEEKQIAHEKEFEILVKVNF